MTPVPLPRLFKLPFVASSFFLVHIHLRLLPSLLPQKPKQTLRDAKKMQFNAPTFRVPPTAPERRYPPNIVVESSLRVWAFSR
jgi:hypothetical protein